MTETNDSPAAVQWNPKIPQAKIRQLYENDAQRIIDENLIDEVGFLLYGRAQNIIMAHDGQVHCPLCHHLFTTPWPWPRSAQKGIDIESTHCPHCHNWLLTGRHYRESLRQAGLGGGSVLQLFQAFVSRYPTATTPRDRTLLIDHLIHEFHYALSRLPDGSLGRNPKPHDVTATNLIEGGHDQVVAFLEGLTYDEGNTFELKTTFETWKAKVVEMKERRSSRR
jgi:hypothetical protein